MSRLKRKEEIAGTTIGAVLLESDSMELYRVHVPGCQSLRFLLLVDPKSLGRSTEQLKQLAFAFPRSTPEAERLTIEQVHGRACLCLLYGPLSADTLEHCFFNQSLCWDETNVAALLHGMLRDLQGIHRTGYVLNGFAPTDVLVDLSNDKLQTRIWNVFQAVRKEEEPFHGPGSQQLILTLANDALDDITTPRNDLFSAAAIAWRLLFQEYPWEAKLSSVLERKEEQIKVFRESPPDTRRASVPGGRLVSNAFRAALQKALQNHYDSADEFMEEIEAITTTSTQAPTEGTSSRKSHAPTDNKNTLEDVERAPALSSRPLPSLLQKGNARGFSAIAGMEDLKDKLKRDVIDILRDPEKAKRYRVTIPNGILLYGPPGCGKSFFAEKFVEETGYRHLWIKSSDLGSIYVHGSQGKIAALFKKAAAHPPCILCFEEFDALVPIRDSSEATQRASEVNEFLSQMSNCSERGIFIIASTNRKDRIDPAAIRTGRIDFCYYVPPPDQAARKALLGILIAGRPGAGAVDCDDLAKRTEGYVPSDLRNLVDEASRLAMAEDQTLTTSRIAGLLATIRPSLPHETLTRYEQQVDANGSQSTMRKIGF